MNFKIISRSLFTLFASVALYSCNSNEDTVVQYDQAATDAQIYAFSLKGTPRIAVDSVGYTALATTKFVINQVGTPKIYNPDSLPYKTNLRKFFMTVKNASIGVSGINIIYKNISNADSIVAWNTSDSVDFSKNNIRLEIIPYAGEKSKRIYEIELRVHQIDPDTIVWKTPALPAWNISAQAQKTVMKGGDFYSFVSNGSSVSMRKFEAQSLNWLGAAQTTDKAIKVESVNVFNNTFYATDVVGNTLKSTDGIAWTNLGATNVISVLGILPAKTEQDDQLLTIIKNTNTNTNTGKLFGKYYFAKTKDMITFDTLKIDGAALNADTVTAAFAYKTIASATNYNRADYRKAALIITGGVNFEGKTGNLTWLIKNGDGNLQLAPNQTNNIFEAKAGIVNFLYDEKLYAFTQNKLYTSTSWGYVWVAAATKQQSVPTSVSLLTDQNVIVDASNYIWIFGRQSSTGAIEVSRGRLNKLIPRN